MPGRDRKGPLGQGAISGRGLGGCRGNAAFDEAPAFGRGRGRGEGGGRGRGRGLGRRGIGAQGAVDSPAGQSQSELERELEELKKRVKAVEE